MFPVRLNVIKESVYLLICNLRGSHREKPIMLSYVKQKLIIKYLCGVLLFTNTAQGRVSGKLLHHPRHKLMSEAAQGSQKSLSQKQELFLRIPVFMSIMKALGFPSRSSCGLDSYQ